VSYKNTNIQKQACYYAYILITFMKIKALAIG